MSESSTIYKLVNPEFTFNFDGKDYVVRKANLDKAIQYQAKAKELADNKDATADLKLLAFCIWIVLKDKDPELTEAYIIEHTPADIDTLECLTTLGFINPKKAEEARKINAAVMGKLAKISENSSSSSQSEPDGLPTK